MRGRRPCGGGTPRAYIVAALHAARREKVALLYCLKYGGGPIRGHWRAAAAALPDNRVCLSRRHAMLLKEKVVRRSAKSYRRLARQW